MKAVSLIEFIVSTDWKTQGKLLDYIGLPEVPNKTNIRIYADFLNQPFTPEMIVEKFKGWKYDDTYNEFFHNSIKIEFDIGGNIFNRIKVPFLPKTLEDFITFCSYADIELEFKEQ